MILALGFQINYAHSGHNMFKEVHPLVMPTL